jgi:hypothetical protein
MTSFGTGAALMVLAIIGLILSERLWVRLLCAAYLGIYVIALGISFATGEGRLDDLMIPSILLVFGLFVWSVKKGYGKY